MKEILLISLLGFACKSINAQNLYSIQFPFTEYEVGKSIYSSGRTFNALTNTYSFQLFGFEKIKRNKYSLRFTFSNTLCSYTSLGHIDLLTDENIQGRLNQIGYSKDGSKRFYEYPQKPIHNVKFEILKLLSYKKIDLGFGVGYNGRVGEIFSSVIVKRVPDQMYLVQVNTNYKPSFYTPISLSYYISKCVRLHLRYSLAYYFLNTTASFERKSGFREYDKVKYFEGNQFNLIRNYNFGLHYYFHEVKKPNWLKLYNKRVRGL